MKLKFLLPVLLIFVVYASVQVFTQDSSQKSAETASEADIHRAPQDGNALIRQSSERIRNFGPFAANIRQRVELFGCQLNGPGLYVQQGGPACRYRLELSLAAEGHVANLLQVSNGRYMYRRVNLPDDDRLTRVDLDMIRESLGKSALPFDLSSPLPAISFGDLASVLKELERKFDFRQIRSGQINETSVWIATGTWSSQEILKLVPDARFGANGDLQYDSLPPQLPHEVEIAFGKDLPLPLFPYRIDFNKIESIEGPRSSSSMIAIEFFNIRPRKYNPADFEYEPGNDEMEDVTQYYLSRAPSLPAEASNQADSSGNR